MKPMVEHGCRRRHRTWTALVRCRWPNNMGVSGNGQYLVVVEPDYTYESGARAFWPHLLLFSTAADAERCASSQHAQRVRVYELPADPRYAIGSDLPFTQEGNRERYGPGPAVTMLPMSEAEVREAAERKASSQRVRDERDRQWKERLAAQIEACGGKEEYDRQRKERERREQEEREQERRKRQQATQQEAKRWRQLSKTMTPEERVAYVRSEIAAKNKQRRDAAKVPDLKYDNPLLTGPSTAEGGQMTNTDNQTPRCWGCGRGYPNGEPPFLVSGAQLDEPLCEDCEARAAAETEATDDLA